MRDDSDEKSGISGEERPNQNRSDQRVGDCWEKRAWGDSPEYAGMAPNRRGRDRRRVIDAAAPATTTPTRSRGVFKKKKRLRWPDRAEVEERGGGCYFAWAYTDGPNVGGPVWARTHG